MNKFKIACIFIIPLILAFSPWVLEAWHDRGRSGSVQWHSWEELENIADTLVEIKVELIALRKELKVVKK